MALFMSLAIIVGFSTICFAENDAEETAIDSYVDFNIDVTIDWDIGDSTVKPESITLYLYKISNGYTTELIRTEVISMDDEGNYTVQETTKTADLFEISKNDDGTYTYTFIVKIIPSEEDYTYSLIEESIDGYITTYSDLEKDSDGNYAMTITNSQSQLLVNVIDDSDEYISGIGMQILNNDGEVVYEWTSSGDTDIIYGLTIGETYTIHADSAPSTYDSSTKILYTYQLAEDLEFTFANGDSYTLTNINVWVADAYDDGYYDGEDVDSSSVSIDEDNATETSTDTSDHETATSDQTIILIFMVIGLVAIAGIYTNIKRIKKL